jgi:ribosomal-protein-alanine N-acetyltransferase
MHILETKRLVVRNLEAADLDALHAICSDPAVMRYLDDFAPYTREKSAAAIENAMQSYETYGFGPWAFVCKAERAFLGFGGIEILPGRSAPEISYILAPRYWGAGLAGEVAAALVAHAFETIGLDTLGASADPRNLASIRIIEKVGMEFVRDGVDEFGMSARFYSIDQSGYLQAKSHLAALADGNWGQGRARVTKTSPQEESR